MDNTPEAIESESFHPPRPHVEERFYAVTVGKVPGVYTGLDDWPSQVEGIPGFAVRTFDTREDAERAYQDALQGGLVEQVQIVGERITLTENELEEIPGIHVDASSAGALKWYSITIGTQPGLYPGSQNISPLVSNVSGNRSFKWGSYEQALSSFLVELRSGRVTKDTTKIIRTRLATP